MDLEEKIAVKKRIVFVLLILFFLLSAALYAVNRYKVSDVTVEGNVHYTAADIRNMVERGWFGDNTLMLSLKYRDKSLTDVPFIETIDVNVVSVNAIKITVHEKQIAGYVNHMDSYMYFDKDGIVVESSDIPTDGLPLVTGLEFDSFNMYAPLPVSNESIFQTILDLTHALEVNGLSTDEINFDSSYRITVSVGRIKLSLGSGDKLAEKIQMASKLLKKKELAGKTGVLHLENYRNGNEKYYFKVLKTN